MCQDEPENNRHFNAVKALADAEGSQCLPICAKLEADIAELDDPEEKAMFMEELGVSESGLDRLIKSSYALLGLISFLTAGSDECRAWTIKRGTKAPQAAGKIHTDFERGFIRAEVIAFEDMVSSTVPSMRFTSAALSGVGLSSPPRNPKTLGILRR